MDPSASRSAAAASTVVVERPAPAAAPPILAAGAESLGGLLDQVIAASGRQAAAPVATRAAPLTPSDNPWPTIAQYVRQHVADETPRRRLPHPSGPPPARLAPLGDQPPAL